MRTMMLTHVDSMIYKNEGERWKETKNKEKIEKGKKKVWNEMGHVQKYDSRCTCLLM